LSTIDFSVFARSWIAGNTGGDGVSLVDLLPNIPIIDLKFAAASTATVAAFLKKLIYKDIL
jgi:hypothetical protein